MNIGKHNFEPHEDAAEEPVEHREPYSTRAERNGRSKEVLSADRGGRHAEEQPRMDFHKKETGNTPKHRALGSSVRFSVTPANE